MALVAGTGPTVAPVEHDNVTVRQMRPYPGKDHVVVCPLVVLADIALIRCILAEKSRIHAYSDTAHRLPSHLSCTTSRALRNPSTVLSRPSVITFYRHFF